MATCLRVLMMTEERTQSPLDPGAAAPLDAVTPSDAFAPPGVAATDVVASPGAGDDRDLLEIDVQLSDDTFDISQGKKFDEVGIKLRFNPRLAVGVGFIVFSFTFYPVIAFQAAMGHVKLASYFYMASWVPFGIGLIIGGQAASRIVTNWHVRLTNAVKSRVIDRRSRERRRS